MAVLTLPRSGAGLGRHLAEDHSLRTSELVLWGAEISRQFPRVPHHLAAITLRRARQRDFATGAAHAESVRAVADRRP